MGQFESLTLNKNNGNLVSRDNYGAILFAKKYP